MDVSLEHLHAYDAFFKTVDRTNSVSTSLVAFLAASTDNDALLMCSETPELMENVFEVAQEGLKETLESISHRIIRSIDGFLSSFKRINTIIDFIQKVRINSVNRLLSAVTGSDPKKPVLSPDAALLASSFISMGLGIAVIYFTGMGPQLWDSIKATRLTKTIVDLLKSWKNPFVKAAVKETEHLRIKLDKIPKTSFVKQASEWTAQKWDAFLNAFSDIPKLIGKIVTGTNNFVSNAAKSFSDTFIKPIATARIVPEGGVRNVFQKWQYRDINERAKFQAFGFLIVAMGSLITAIGVAVKNLWRLVKYATNYKEPAR